MKALLYDAKEKIYVSEYPMPEPETGEALIKIKYAGICGSDIVAWRGGFKRITKPVILGHEFIGEIVKISGGEAEKEFKVGQRVAVEPLVACGKCEPCKSGNYHVCRTLKVIGLDRNGGMAEYVAVPTYRLHPIPDILSWEKAAVCEPIAVGVHMVRRTGLKIGDKVAILGAGPIGLSVAMVARKAGASGIVVTEINPFRIRLARELGFEVIDGKNDPSDAILEYLGCEGADVSFEAAATAETLNTALKVTKVRGTILQGGVFKEYPGYDAQGVTLKEQTITGSRVYSHIDFEISLGLLSQDDFNAEKMITNTVSIDDAISEGFEAIVNGEDVMKILIKP